MSDIYLSLTETPAVVTLSQPVAASQLSTTVTVANVVSVNVVTMPAINVTAAAPSVTTVAGSVSVSNFPATQVVSVSNLPAAQVVTGTVALDAASLAALESVTVTVGNVTIGSSVSISNFPSTQTIAGTVTANVGGIASGVTIPVRLFAEKEGESPTGQDTLLQCNSSGALLIDIRSGGESAVGFDGDAFLQVKQVQGSSVTIGSLPAISGTVTANVANYSATAVSYSSSSVTGIPVVLQTNGVYGGTLQGYNGVNSYVHVGLESVGGNSLRFGGTLPVSGTVTVGNSITIGSVPNGSLTTRFGSVTTANTAEATSAVTNASRKYLLIQNVTTGSNVITVGIGFTPTTTQGIQLTAGAGITFESSYIPTGAVYVLSSVTASPFTVLEA